MTNQIKLFLCYSKRRACIKWYKSRCFVALQNSKLKERNNFSYCSVTEPNSYAWKENKT